MNTVSRAASTTRELNFSAPLRQRKRWADEDEEEDYGEEDDEALDSLRRQHREAARKVHTSDDNVKFADFSLNEKLVNQLYSLGYQEPFAIQAKTLKHTLEGKDVIGRAVTGSGKTMAFSIPIVHKLLESGVIRGRSRNPKAIVISPTRELCMQIYRSIQELNPAIRCVAVYGGDSITRQERIIRQGVDVVCATPGRLNDHLERGNLGLEALEFLCLDEADELLTPNFKDQIEDVLLNSPSSKQMMLFSATLPPDIKYITRRYMKSPVHVDISSEQNDLVPKNIKHLAVMVPESQYPAAVAQLVSDHNAERCITFTNTKVNTVDVSKALKKLGIKADALNSDLSQNRREAIMSAFRSGKVHVLVATDVAARGLDVPECDLVIQAGVPRNGLDYYVHRSGRTGRGGRPGVSVLLHPGRGEKASYNTLREICRSVDIKTMSLDMGKLNEKLLQDLILKIENVHNRRIEKPLQILKSLKFSAEQTEELLAKAIVMLRHGVDVDSDAPPPTHRGGRPDVKDFGFAGRRSFERDNRAASFRFQDDFRSGSRWERDRKKSTFRSNRREKPGMYSLLEAEEDDRV